MKKLPSVNENIHSVVGVNSQNVQDFPKDYKSVIEIFRHKIDKHSEDENQVFVPKLRHCNIFHDDYQEFLKESSAAKGENVQETVCSRG